ncbi:MAG: type II toxin-antitoxin system HicB family antitoxin [Firmicutes bacterium]|nr:type II toxin-antitoxin system HicB family antitoxin [Bacillota bacterium]MBQ6662103.1 type II toxin-antitoxin system HicB family antitoxin [Bacillota bacterium]
MSSKLKGNKNELQYKGYRAKIVFDADEKTLYGVIDDIVDLVDFSAKSSDEIESAFRNAVDDYLAFCAEQGKEPEQQYHGVFQVRTTPDTHRKLAKAARASGVALNNLVNEVLTDYVGKIR